jgi:Lon protease-like protein
MSDELGLFTLEVVLFPTERIPLHIFEPRYKELIGECLRDEREFGLVLADETGGRREIGTRAVVIEVLQVFDDGRLNILVEGRERFRILDETEGRSFRTGAVEPLEDEPDPATKDEVDRALDVFGRLVEVTESDEVQRPEPDSDILSFELAAKVDFGPELKQEILELRSERERLVRLADLFEVAVQGLKLEKDVRQRASGNGKVDRLPQLPEPESEPPPDPPESTS